MTKGKFGEFEKSGSNHQNKINQYKESYSNKCL